MSILLEVSIGEALDKLTILDIKKDFINDNRKIEVEREYNYLYNTCITYINNYEYYYNILKKINREIWILQDELRLGNIDRNKHSEILEEILNLNDSRFLIKKKINDLSMSRFREQKGYQLRKIYLYNSSNRDTQISNLTRLQPFINYLSILYDEVYLYVLPEFHYEVRHMFINDSSIIFYYEINEEIEKKIEDNDFIVCGDNYELYKDKIKVTHKSLLNISFTDENEIDELYIQLCVSKKKCQSYIL